MGSQSGWHPSAAPLEAIQVLRDGEFEFWYDDGDLFWGHSIIG
jgi:hypothetical protein